MIRSLVISLAVIAGGGLLGCSPEPGSKAEARQNIELCDSEAKNPSTLENKAAFTKESCEFLRDRFRQKFKEAP